MMVVVSCGVRKAGVSPQQRYNIILHYLDYSDYNNTAQHKSTHTKALIHTKTNTDTMAEPYIPREDKSPILSYPIHPSIHHISRRNPRNMPEIRQTSTPKRKNPSPVKD